MLNENIKKIRKAKGLSQEELAVKLNVVRQTVSKWENGLSIPDADLLIKLANVLDVKVSALLDITEEDDRSKLAQELARVNDILAHKQQEAKLLQEANNKRNSMIFLNFVALILALIIKDEIMAILLISAAILSAIYILYRNLALLTALTTDDLRLGVLRLTTLFNVAILIGCIIISLLLSSNTWVIKENEGKIISLMIVVMIMVFTGSIADKLPFNRHTGLRLPWTVRDEQTWRLAHKILSYISLPIAILYIAAAFSFKDFEFVSLIAIGTWIIIPALLSLVYFYKKYNSY
ncbi:MAG: helix-turn-helix domain-containing protein [Erysipelotrichaceae bacterium]|nr:helix-turn-helix domain-containing protein [Erysipelotrichaceae bacterium]MDY5251930.1 helix-turn-helix domain-containing protein [Erysipelotrichaceae bacterium]